MNLMVLIGGEAQLEARFAHLEIVLILTQDTWFALNIPLARKSFLTDSMEILGDVGHLESRFPLFGYSVSVGAR
jgi:hypothetical protein